MELLAGFGVLFAFAGASLGVLWKAKILSKPVALLFVLSLLVHVAFVLFIFMTAFQPFGGGGGDFVNYYLSAEGIAERVRQGNFSLEGAWVNGEGLPHYFPVLVGYLFLLTAPFLFVGQMLNAGIAAVSVVLLYFLVLEVGASRSWAFFVGLFSNLYPSFLFFTSYLMKEPLVIALSLAGVLLGMRLLKDFSWRKFALFFVLVLLLLHFRVYLGYILMAAFLLSWFFLHGFSARRFAVSLGIVVLLGFAPLVLDPLPYLDAPSHGYYGIEDFKLRANPETVAHYQEIHVSEKGEEENSTVRGLNIAERATLAVIGPFPLHFSVPRHYAALLETVPWLLVLPLVVAGVVRKFWYRPRDPALLLLLFALGLFAELALFVNNFGIVMRIRIPAFLALLPFLPFGVAAIFSRLKRPDGPS